MLGAGGAARAVAMALLEAGCPVLVLANRTYERAARLVAVLQEYFPQAQVRAVPLAEAAPVARQSGLLINATSVGLHEASGALLPDTCFHPDQVVYDLVYRPLYTPLLAGGTALWSDDCAGPRYADWARGSSLPDLDRDAVSSGGCTRLLQPFFTTAS